MQRLVHFLFFALILILIDAKSTEVTHEEIRGTIQSLIYSYNQLDNKLERHEHRERALGELLKKALQSLQKGQKSLEPLNGIFSRLDERVSQMETMLLTQEDKYNVQGEKLGHALDEIFKYMRDNDECLKRSSLPSKEPTITVTPQPDVSITDFVNQQNAVNIKLSQEVKSLSENVEKLLRDSTTIMNQTEITSKSVSLTTEILAKIDDNLLSLKEPLNESTQFQSDLLSKFGYISNNIVELKEKKPNSAEGLSTNDKNFIESLANETIGVLSQLKLASENSGAKETELIGSSAVCDKLFKEMNANHNRLNEGIDVFNKFNNILITNSEYIIDTQRKVEFGTLRTIQQIGDLLDKQSDGVLAILKDRFDTIDENVIRNNIELVRNISSIIESEISHVWHQIEIMNGEITESKDLINLVQKRSEVFVNSSFSTMDALSTKVEMTKVRMLDMDSNLNFLLGKLSVMSQEFISIKNGLAESLDELRRNFHSMQGKMPQGTGAYTNPKNEYETELNLLNKRQAT